jgi:regulation of enolase protein 1 (concanavalin A-like superfamily)
VELADLLPGLRLSWLVEPAASQLEPDGVRITAGPATDWFIDPSGASEPMLNAPALAGPTDRDFLLSARVAVDFASTFDAGVLVLFANWGSWAKLCFERSPQGQPMVVSVVTREVSDDSNSFVVEADHVWLRVARIGSAFAFHASADGAVWGLIRHFGLPAADTVLAGFEAQSPLGEGCTASFTSIRYEARTLPDLRSGA